MRVAMLSPGPSLEKYSGRDGYDLVVGVNRVVFQHECDWWSLADDTAYLQRDDDNPVPWGRRVRLGNPRLFVKRWTIAKINQNQELCELRDAIAGMTDEKAREWLSRHFKHEVPMDNVTTVRAHKGSTEDKAAWLKDEPRARFHDECLLPLMPDTHLRVLPGTARWDKFGGPTALCLCWFIGGTEIDVYGADMGGYLDAQGYHNPTRHDRRWALERSIWTLLAEGFTNAGVTIRRIL